MNQSYIRNLVTIWGDLMLLRKYFFHWVSTKLILYFYIGIPIYAILWVMYLVAYQWYSRLPWALQIAMNSDNTISADALQALLQNFSGGDFFILFAIALAFFLMIALIIILIAYGYALLLEAYHQYSMGVKPFISHATIAVLAALLLLHLGGGHIPSQYDGFFTFFAIVLIFLFYVTLRRAGLPFYAWSKFRQFWIYTLWSTPLVLIPFLPILGFLFILFLSEQAFRFLSWSENSVAMNSISILSLALIAWTIIWEIIMNIRIMIGYIALVRSPVDKSIVPREALGIGMRFMRGNMFRVFSLLIPCVFIILLLSYLCTDYDLISRLFSLPISAFDISAQAVKQSIAIFYFLFFVGIDLMIIFSLYRIFGESNFPIKTP